MNVAIVEFNNFHDECIYSQVVYLKSSAEVKVFLVCNYRMKNRIQYLNMFEDILTVRSNQWGVGHLKILNFLKRNRIEKVIFNSSLYKPVSNLLRICSSKKRDYFGLVHNKKLLIENKNSQLVKRMKGYFFLNDYLLDDIDNYLFVKKKCTSYYPIFFQKHKAIPLVKQTDEIWVTIPGRMQKSRRDYDTLLNCFKSGKLNKNVKLLFLGQSVFVKDHGQDIRKEFEKYDTNQSCIFWDKFIDKDVFQSYMEKSDFILPLIHSNHVSIEEYKNKISGSFNLAFGYNIPLIMDHFFRQFEDFERTSLFYHPDEDIINVLNRLTPPNKEKMYNHEKWSFDFQCKSLLAF